MKNRNDNTACNGLTPDITSEIAPCAHSIDPDPVTSNVSEVERYSINVAHRIFQ